MIHPHMTRRGLLLGLTATLALGGARAAFAQAQGDRRLVVILLRGALDGLYAVPPYGDRGLAALRGDHVLPEPGREGGVLDLGGSFGLHPAMTRMHALYRAGELAVFHAVAGSYRVRSHFDAQDMLESGADQRLSSGWLNRALAAFRDPPRVRAGIAVGNGVPLLLRGPAQVGALGEQSAARPELDLMERLRELYADDRDLAPAFAEGLRSRGFARETLLADGPIPAGQGFPSLAGAAGRLLAAADGPRVAALEIGGWDTHADQARRLVPPLRQLDAGLAALKEGLGEAWRRTAVLVVTEFGRTARFNGTNGTDHGTAGVAFIAGGTVLGGRVVADWPGLAENRLFENRDLMPTRDLRTLAKGLLRDHLRLSPQAVAQAFPGSDAAPPQGGLLRA